MKSKMIHYPIIKQNGTESNNKTQALHWTDVVDGTENGNSSVALDLDIDILKF